MSRTDKNGHKITYTYDANNNVSKIVDTQSREVTLAHNADGKLQDMDDVAGVRDFDYAYTAQNGSPSDLLTSYTDPAGDSTVYEYTSGGNLKAIVDPRGNRTEIGYAQDSEGYYRVASVARVTAATGDADPRTTYTYDLAAGTTTVTDPRGNETTTVPSDGQTVYTWDKVAQQVEKTKNAKNQDADTEFTPNGDAKRFTDQSQSGTGAVPAITQLNYAETDASGSNDPTNNLNGGSLPSGETFSFDYYDDSGERPGDLLGRYRMQQSTSTQGNSLFYDYDSAGNLTKVRDSLTPATEADLTYTQAGGTEPKGLLKSAEDGEDHVTTYNYDVKGNLIRIVPPSPLGDIDLVADAVSRVDRRTDAKGQWADYTYDALDRVTRIDMSNGAWFTFGYDGNGNLTSRSDSAGNNSTFVYDELNRRTRETVDGATTTYSYDANSNLKTLTDGWGTTTYGYDEIDRVNSVDDPTNPAITYTYNDTAQPRARTLTFPGGQTLRTETALSGKVTKIEANASTGASLRGVQYTYKRSTTGAPETLLRLSSTDIANGSPGSTTTYAYDNLDRLCWATTTGFTSTSCSATPPNTSASFNYRYSYDKASNRKTKTVGGFFQSGTTTSYGTNNANQLCWSTTAAVSSNACTPTPSGATTYTHDPNGNRTSGGGLTLAYDVFDRLSSANGAALGYRSPDNRELLTDGTTTLRNNMLGLGASTTAATTTNYLRDPDGNLIAERAGTTTRYVVPDALGSTRWLLAGDTVSRAYSYDPDGNTTTTNGTGTDTIIRYAGGHRTNSGLYHFGHRYYDPTTARWTQRDPLDQPDDLKQANLYLYAAADPVNLSDPLGLYGVGDFVGDVVEGADEVYQWGRRTARSIYTSKPVRKVTGCLGYGYAEAQKAGPAAPWQARVGYGLKGCVEGFRSTH